jgi:hypothetical protein
MTPFDLVDCCKRLTYKYYTGERSWAVSFVLNGSESFQLQLMNLHQSEHSLVECCMARPTVTVSVML